ncbi:MAG: cytosine deaminase [Coleofasciculaceae cyanobacterium]
MEIPTTSHYWLQNAHVPTCLLTDEVQVQQTRENLSLVDIEIDQGEISQVTPARYQDPGQIPTVDLRKGQVWPCFVDMHTHLDKGHIWERTPNLDKTFSGALSAFDADTEKHGSAEDFYRRMEFGLKCSYAHGSKAIRTHINCAGEAGAISLEAIQTLQKEWREKIILQVVALVDIDYYRTDAGVALADKIAEMGGILGGIALINPELDKQLDVVFSLAKERNLELDFHTDETDNPESECLRRVALAAMRHDFNRQIICGHCCSLAVQEPEVVAKTMELVRQVNIGVVSLPLCNLYLQDRQINRTPYWRGITLLQELKQHGIPATVASDNCRDPFHSFGDHDVLEVFAQSVKIGHLDLPYGDWPTAVTKMAADLIGLPEVGRIAKGLAADLVLFKGRNFSELLSRSQHERVVLRNGKQIDTTLPDYAELDDLVS